MAFNSDVLRELSSRFLTLAEKHGVKSMIMNGHRQMATSLLVTGDILESRAHFDKAIALYDPVEHRPLAERFGQDARVWTLSHRSWALWILGFPEAALKDADQAVSEARQIGHAVTLMLALYNAAITQGAVGKYEVATAQNSELCELADEKGSGFWGSGGLLQKGSLLALTGKAAALDPITRGITAWKSTGATQGVAFSISLLAKIYADLGRYDDACQTIGEALAAIETSGERYFEADVKRMAGEIALMLPQPDAPKAEAYFQRALEVARKQQAKSWELRAAMSMARLWRDQGKRDEARELLASVYGWFTEGFGTLDLKQAKALLDELA
jgi:predicted ATPase